MHYSSRIVVWDNLLFVSYMKSSISIHGSMRALWVNAKGLQVLDEQKCQGCWEAYASRDRCLRCVMNRTIRGGECLLEPIVVSAVLLSCGSRCAILEGKCNDQAMHTPRACWSGGGVETEHVCVTDADMVSLGDSADSNDDAAVCFVMSSMVKVKTTKKHHNHAWWMKRVLRRSQDPVLCVLFLLQTAVLT